jgi:hypothetical protein
LRTRGRCGGTTRGGGDGTRGGGESFGYARRRRPRSSGRAQIRRRPL